MGEGPRVRHGGVSNRDAEGPVREGRWSNVCAEGVEGGVVTEMAAREGV